MTDPDQVIEAIETGQHDGRLADIVAACRLRADEAGRSLRWRISLDGDVWDEDTITIGEMRMVERTTGVNWSELTPLRSADIVTAFVIAHWHKVSRMELQDAWEKAEALNAKALLEAVSEYEVEEPGKGQAPPTT